MKEAPSLLRDHFSEISSFIHFHPLPTSPSFTPTVSRGPFWSWAEDTLSVLWSTVIRSPQMSWSSPWDLGVKFSSKRCPQFASNQLAVVNVSGVGRNSRPFYILGIFGQNQLLGTHFWPVLMPWLAMHIEQMVCFQGHVRPVACWAWSTTAFWCEAGGSWMRQVLSRAGWLDQVLAVVSHFFHVSCLIHVFGGKDFIIFYPLLHFRYFSCC